MRAHFLRHPHRLVCNCEQFRHSGICEDVLAVGHWKGHIDVARKLSSLGGGRRTRPRGGLRESTRPGLIREDAPPNKKKRRNRWNVLRHLIFHLIHFFINHLITPSSIYCSVIICFSLPHCSVIYVFIKPLSSNYSVIIQTSTKHYLHPFLLFITSSNHYLYFILYLFRPHQDIIRISLPYSSHLISASLVHVLFKSHSHAGSVAQPQQRGHMASERPSGRACRRMMIPTPMPWTARTSRSTTTWKRIRAGASPR